LNNLYTGQHQFKHEYNKDKLVIYTNFKKRQHGNLSLRSLFASQEKQKKRR